MLVNVRQSVPGAEHRPSVCWPNNLRRGAQPRNKLTNHSGAPGRAVATADNVFERHGRTSVTLYSHWGRTHRVQDVGRSCRRDRFWDYGL